MIEVRVVLVASPGAGTTPYVKHRPIAPNLGLLGWSHFFPLNLNVDVYPISIIRHGVNLGSVIGISSLSMVRELCSRSASPRKYGRSSTTKGFSTTSLMRIMALLDDILGDSLYTNREKIEISQVFMEI